MPASSSRPSSSAGLQSSQRQPDLLIYRINQLHHPDTFVQRYVRALIRVSLGDLARKRLELPPVCAPPLFPSAPVGQFLIPQRSAFELLEGLAFPALEDFVAGRVAGDGRDGDAVRQPRGHEVVEDDLRTLGLEGDGGRAGEGRDQTEEFRLRQVRGQGCFDFTRRRRRRWFAAVRVWIFDSESCRDGIVDEFVPGVDPRVGLDHVELDVRVGYVPGGETRHRAEHVRQVHRTPAPQAVLEPDVVLRQDEPGQQRAGIDG